MFVSRFPVLCQRIANYPTEGAEWGKALILNVYKKGIILSFYKNLIPQIRGHISTSTRTLAKCPKDLLLVASSKDRETPMPIAIENKIRGLQYSWGRPMILIQHWVFVCFTGLDKSQVSMKRVARFPVQGSKNQPIKLFLNLQLMRRKTQRIPYLLGSFAIDQAASTTSVTWLSSHWSLWACRLSREVISHVGCFCSFQHPQGTHLLVSLPWVHPPSTMGLPIDS